MEGNTSNGVWDTIAVELRKKRVSEAVRKIRQFDPSIFLTCSYFVDFFAEEDVTPERGDRFMETPLHFMAAEACSTPCAHVVLKLMIERSCPQNLRVTDNLGANCLQSVLLLCYEHVCDQLMLRTVRLLLDHMPSDTIGALYQGENVLHIAAQNREHEVVTLLKNRVPKTLLEQPDSRYKLTPLAMERYYATACEISAMIVEE